MSATSAPGTTESNSLPSVRERLITHSEVAIWDSGSFEQMQRVGIVLAKSGLVPESLCKQGDEWLPEQVVAARCVLICNQARLWGADPLNVLQCTSLINGRLMYEGKLVNAVVQHLTGVKLRFELGIWNTDHIEIPEDKSALHGIGERLAVRCFDPADPSREVSGSAGMWKTDRSGSPWKSPNNWPRQLRYRAAREWARAYEPGAILGILADGDGDDTITMPEAPRTSGIMGRLSGNQDAPGFDPQGVHEAAEKATKSRRAKAAQVEPEEPVHQDAPEPETPATEIPAEPEAVESGPPDVVEPAASSEETQVFDPSPSPSEGSTSASNTASHDGGVISASPSEEERIAAQNTEAEVHAGPAPRDVTYFLSSEEIGADDKLQLYRNGEPFSRVGEAGLTKHPTYDTHPEPETKEPGIPEAYEAYIDAIEAAKSWDDAKVAMSTFYRTPTFTEMTTDQQNRVRANTWITLKEAKIQGLPDPIFDISAFRLWIEAQDEEAAIRGTYDILRDQAVYKAKDQQSQEIIDNAVISRVSLLRK